MEDFTRCPGGDCPMKETCWRYACPERTEKTVEYASPPFNPKKIPKCYYFAPESWLRDGGESQFRIIMSSFRY